MKLVVDGLDVTDYVAQVTWSGDMQQIARTLAVSFERGFRPSVGDKLTFSWEKQRLFAGMIMYVDIDRDAVSCEAYDAGIYLANNECYREYVGTPQSITREVCKQFGVPVGKLAERKGSTKVTSTGSMSGFKVIERAYEGEKGKLQYSFRLDNGKLTVEKAGTVSAGTVDVEIQSASRSISIKDMVNRVIITDEKKLVGSVENDGQRRKYGTFQKTYQKQKGKKATAEAKELLRGLSRTGSVQAVGNPKCIAGRAVTVTEARTGLSGRQIIKSDKHTFTPDGGYDMSLEFYYEE